MINYDPFNVLFIAKQSKLDVSFAIYLVWGNQMDIQC